MSTFDESVLQTAPAPAVEAPTVQDLHNQPGHTVWFFTVEALLLPIERRLPHLQVRGKTMVCCIDHRYQDINPSVEVFSNSAFDIQPLAMHVKTAYSVADEYRTFAGQRGGVIFEELLDADDSVASAVWRWLFPQGLTTTDDKGERRPWSIGELQERLPTPVEPRTAASILRGFGGNANRAEEILETTLGRVAGALTEAVAYRTQLLDWIIRDAERTNSRVILRDAERNYFAEAGLEVPDDQTSAAREDEKAEKRGVAMGAEIGAQIADAQEQTLKIVSTAVGESFAQIAREMSQSRQADDGKVARLEAEVAELKALIKGGNSNAENEAKTSDGASGAKPAGAAGNAGSPPRGNGGTTGNRAGSTTNR